MQRIKPWQTATLAVIAIVIAVGFLWRTYARTQAQPPIPAPFTGTAPMQPSQPK